MPGCCTCSMVSTQGACSYCNLEWCEHILLKAVARIALCMHSPQRFQAAERQRFQAAERLRFQAAEPALVTIQEQATLRHTNRKVAEGTAFSCCPATSSYSPQKCLRTRKRVRRLRLKVWVVSDQRLYEQSSKPERSLSPGCWTTEEQPVPGIVPVTFANTTVASTPTGTRTVSGNTAPADGILESPVTLQ